MIDKQLSEIFSFLKVFKKYPGVWHCAKKVRLKAILAFVALFWRPGQSCKKNVLMSNLHWTLLMTRMEVFWRFFIPEGPKMANVSHLRRDLRQPVRIYLTAPPANFKFVVRGFRLFGVGMWRHQRRPPSTPTSSPQGK